MKYDITITRTGGVAVEAETAEAAIEKVNTMTVAEIEKHGQLTGWEASDALPLESEDENNV